MDESRKQFNLISNSIDEETRESLGMSFNLTGVAGKITNPDEMLIVTNQFKKESNSNSRQMGQMPL
jgi:hypothetical protein